MSDGYSPTYSSTHPAHILASLNLQSSNNQAASASASAAGPSASSPPSQLFYISDQQQQQNHHQHQQLQHQYYSVDPYATTQSNNPNTVGATSSISPSSSTIAPLHPHTQVAGLNPAASKGKKRTTPAQPKDKTSPTDENDGEGEDEDADGVDEKKKRRRRVVVACDTCRRKKVKCRGLPNATSTCENCAAYNYKCTFSADQDRSRGKYEILESKAETLLAALRSVAPHLADEYERGGLNITGPSGSSRHPNEDWTGLERSSAPSSSNQNHDSGSTRRTSDTPLPGGAPAGPRLGASPFEVATILPPLPVGSRPSLPSIRSLGAPFTAGSSLGPMVPDLEDGRPRFFGKSSTLSHFHALDSRPPSISPPPENRGGSSVNWAGTVWGDAQERDSFARTSATQPIGSMRPPTLGINKSGLTGTAGPSTSTRYKSAPRTQPLYPSNSREWVHLLRRKNTVAVGRDDICTDEWVGRYQLPSNDLVLHLLDDIYFPHLHPLLPILHPPTFRRDIRNGRASHDTAFRGLVFCILTISSRFSKDPRVLADPDDPFSAGDHWAAGSRLYHQTFAASLINVQVLLLTATFMHASIGPGSSWTILGVAIRALQDIGLHQERANVDFTPFDQEMRRRVFWSTFILDCIFAVCLGRPNAMKLEDCNVHLPLDISDEDLLECEISGQPITATLRTSDDVKSEEKEDGGDGAEDKKRQQQPTHGVASGFRHMVKLNLLVHDVIQILYSHRKTSAQPEWLAHPVIGPTTHPGEEAPHPDSKEGKDSKDKDQVSSKVSKTPSLKKPEYKAMALLCKRLDEWVAETPEHLQDLSTTPFKLQAGIVSCGRHDIRLYILKPFLPDPFLYNMLRPQCTAHARACLITVLDLYECGHLGNMVFIFTQAFMSSITFLLTVWHVTQNVKDILPDLGLIERTARMMATAFDDRYCSAVFKKAQRVLHRLATRLLPVLSEDQRKRLVKWTSFNDRKDLATAAGSSSRPSKGSSASNPHSSLLPQSSERSGPAQGHTMTSGDTFNFATSGSHGNGTILPATTPPRSFTSTKYPWQTNGAAGAMGGRGQTTRTQSRAPSRTTSRQTSPSSFALEHWRSGWKPTGLSGNSGAQSPNGNGAGMPFSPFTQRLNNNSTSATSQGFGSIDDHSSWPGGPSPMTSAFQSYPQFPSRDSASGAVSDPFTNSGVEYTDANFGDSHGILGSGGFGHEDVNLDFLKLFEGAEAEFGGGGSGNGVGDGAFMATPVGGDGQNGPRSATTIADHPQADGQDHRSDAWQEDFLHFLSGFDLPTNDVVSDLLGGTLDSGSTSAG